MRRDNIMYHFYLQAVMECNRLVLKQFFGMRWLVGGVDSGCEMKGGGCLKIF